MVAGVGGGRDRRADHPGAAARRAAARPLEPGRRGGRGAGRDRPRAARRRARRRVPAARPLERPDGRRRARDRRAAGRARPLPRARRVDARGDRDGRDAADRPRRAAGVLAAARPDRLPAARAPAAPHAVRRPVGRARLRRRVHPRRRAGAADDRLPAGRAARRQRRAGRRRRRGRCGDRRAGHRARDRRPPAVVGLRAVGAEHGRRARGRLLLEPRLQPAELAARRPRAAAGQGVDPGLLEGGRPRRVRRPHLASGPAPAQRGPRQPAPGRRRQPGALVAADRGHAAQHPDRHVRHRRHRDRGDRRGRLPDRRRHLQRDHAARARRRLLGGRLHAAARGARAARGRHLLRGLAARLPVAVRPGAPGGGPAGRPPARPRRLPRLGRRREAADRAVRRRPREGRPAAAPQRARARVEAVARAQGGSRHAVRVRRGGRALPRHRVLLLRAPAAGVRDARRLPVRLQDRLLPAVLRRRGAAAAAPHRRGLDVHARLHPAVDSRAVRDDQRPVLPHHSSR